MKDPIGELEEEHRAIETVLAALSRAVEQEIDIGFYKRAVEFITSFADKYHHSKEEDLLFPLLEGRASSSDSSPIDCLYFEHEAGRRHVRRMSECILAGDLEGLRRESLDYVALLRHHIEIEDTILFPWARNVLHEYDLLWLRFRFDEVERLHEQRHRDYQSMGDKLLGEANTTK